jgi:hypothetical protein
MTVSARTHADEDGFGRHYASRPIGEAEFENEIWARCEPITIEHYWSGQERRLRVRLSATLLVGRSSPRAVLVRATGAVDSF